MAEPSCRCAAGGGDIFDMRSGVLTQGQYRGRQRRVVCLVRRGAALVLVKLALAPPAESAGVLLQDL
ncbi:hypothetical protein ACFQ7M_19690 [Streptomyces massasporeus]